MTIAAKLIKPAFAAFLLSAGSASATLVCPGGQTFPQYGPGDYEYCPVVDPTPDILPPVIAEGGTSFSAAAAEARAAARAQSRAEQRQFQKQAQRQQQSQTATGGNSQATGGSVRNVGNTTINQRSAASSVNLPSSTYVGAQNCFGDVDPSGSFSAGIQVLGWGVAADARKASNICAAAALGGPELALRYLMRHDPKMPRTVTMQRTTTRCPASHPVFVEGKGCRK